MNVEENRLRTFNQWPTDVIVEPARIAKGGFFYTGQNLEVQCFCCGGKISEWNYGDQVMAKHRKLDPRCPFVLNHATSGNVPILASPSTVSTIQPDMKIESNRLTSYAKWPISHIVKIEDLARAGFYYLQKEDKVKCAFCNGVVGQWETEDCPLDEHRKHFPECPFILKLTPSTEDLVSDKKYNEKVILRDDLGELGIVTHSGPKQSKYATEVARMQSFAKWPEGIVQTPEALVEAGFYYTGTADQVRCFHCDGGLRRWDPEDQPWMEHARWFPKCGFVQLVKGVEFINSCRTEPDVFYESRFREIPNQTTVDTGNTRCFVPVRTVTDQELQTLMDSPVAVTALGIGLHFSRIKQAIRLKMEQTGLPFSTADALIEAALNIQLEESDSNTETTSQISENVSAVLESLVTQEFTESLRRVVPKETICNTVVNEELVRPISLEEENRRLKEARLCKICLDCEVGVVFLPCGHLATCVNCAPSLKDCPVCRSSIKANVRTFLS